MQGNNIERMAVFMRGRACGVGTEFVGLLEWAEGAVWKGFDCLEVELSGRSIDGNKSYEAFRERLGFRRLFSGRGDSAAGAVTDERLGSIFLKTVGECGRT